MLACAASVHVISIGAGRHRLRSIDHAGAVRDVLAARRTGIYATPVDAARARGLLGFDIGVGVTAIPVDTNAEYWLNAVDEDFTVSDHVVVPRLIVSKGLSVATISAMYASVPDSDITMLGASLDVPIIDGGVLKPTPRAARLYATLQGIDELDLNTYGLEVFLSKGRSDHALCCRGTRAQRRGRAHHRDARVHR
jgi:hypothetical protein